ncbi:MAG TPA: hypothetical protein VK731_00790 [Candidatus Cybelea sp.]|nr:hypothetical protein [Candidatus Cybelea sp.]
MNPDEPKERRRFPIFLEIVIVLIAAALLAALLVPSVFHNTNAYRIAHARNEMINLVAAISQYQTEYGKLPASDNVVGSPDFTFGTFGTSDEALGITNSSGYQANNSEVMSILMDVAAFSDGKPTVNVRHGLNPQNIVFLNVKMTSNTNSPGLGPDNVYRDPWGHPYIITIDVNGDKKCRDAFYRLASVSENASVLGSKSYLLRAPPPYDSDEARDSFEVPNVTVTIWSFGPDGKADKMQKANEGVNKDNITSW